MKLKKMASAVASNMQSAAYGIQGRVAAGAIALTAAGSASAEYTPDARLVAAKAQVDGDVNFFLDWGYEIVITIATALLVWTWIHKIRKKAS